MDKSKTMHAYKQAMIGIGLGAAALFGLNKAGYIQLGKTDEPAKTEIDLQQEIARDLTRLVHF